MSSRVCCKIYHKNSNWKVFENFCGWWCYEQFFYPSNPNARIEKSKIYIWRHLIFINKNNSTAFYREILFTTPTDTTPANFNGYYAITGQGGGQVIGGIGNLSITYTNGATISYTGTGDPNTTISLGGGVTVTLPPTIYSLNGTQQRIKRPKYFNFFCFDEIYAKVYNLNNPTNSIQS